MGYLESIFKDVHVNEPVCGQFRYEAGLHRSLVQVFVRVSGGTKGVSITPRSGGIGLRGAGTTIGRWDIQETTLRVGGSSQCNIEFSGDWCLTDSEMSALVAQTGDTDVWVNANLFCDVVMDQPQERDGLHCVDERTISRRFARSDWG